MKTETCPECGTWSERSEDGNSLVTHFDKDRWRFGPECETCKKAHESRMFAIGESLARRQTHAIMDAFLADAPKEQYSFRGTWQDIEQQMERQRHEYFIQQNAAD